MNSLHQDLIVKDSSELVTSLHEERAFSIKHKSPSILKTKYTKGS